MEPTPRGCNKLRDDFLICTHKIEKVKNLLKLGKHLRPDNTAHQPRKKSVPPRQKKTSRKAHPGSTTQASSTSRMASHLPIDDWRKILEPTYHGAARLSLTHQSPHVHPSPVTICRCQPSITNGNRADKTPLPYSSADHA